MNRTVIILLFVSLIFSCKGKEKESNTSGNEIFKEIVERDITYSNDELLYRQHCGTCHQYDGHGVPGMYPPLVNTMSVQGDPSKLIKMVLEGITSPTEGREETYAGVMPPQDYLSDEQISEILTYIRTVFGEKSSAVSKSEVEGVRKNLEL
jgi:cytochrome c553